MCCLLKRRILNTESYENVMFRTTTPAQRTPLVINVLLFSLLLKFVFRYYSHLQIALTISEAMCLTGMFVALQDLN